MEGLQLYILFNSISVIQCSAEAAFLRHCRTNFENDTAKTVPRDIWRTMIFGLAQDFKSASCMENSHAKNNFFTRIPVVVTTVLIGVLDF